MHKISQDLALYCIFNQKLNEFLQQKEGVMKEILKFELMGLESFYQIFIVTRSSPRDLLITLFYSSSFILHRESTT